MGAYFADSGRDAGHATASIMPFDSGPVIVALGASAGGLEALHGFFGGMPADPRFAFVVVTHLPPQRGSRLAEVLRRATAMPVTEAQDGERVEPAQVYVIPPNRLMGIEDGRLRLEQAVPRPAIPHPIDYFMSALADDRQERSVGIVLSGADHDGTAGLKEIKAAGGLVMVQDPASAQFPGMPTSAISADVPDAVLTVDRMGQALIDYIEHVPEDGVADCAPTASPEVGDAGVAGRLGEILAVVRERSGQDFRGYRSAMLLRRLRRRMGLKAVGDASGYLDLLKTSDDEVQALVKDFRISVTEFFRQPDAWHALEKGALPQLIEERMAARTGIRVWTPGCATGEESYSIAMLLLEQLGERGGDAAVNVFASDVDAAALAVARAGSYPESIVDSIDPLRVVRFFEKQNDRYVVRKQLRESVLFAPHDLVQDPPFSKLDLIVCRNVLIYFEPEQQGRILEMFHFALNPHGILFLGKSESLGLQSDLFEPVSAPFRIFRRVGSAVRVPRPFQGQWSGPRGFLTPAATSPPQAGLPAERVRRHLGDRVPQAAVLVNRDFRALYFHGEAGRFLQPSGEPAWDLLSLLRDGMRGRVRAALQQAITVGGPVDAKVHMKRDRHRVPVNVRVEPLEDFGRSGLLVVCFDERGVAPGGPSQDDPSELSELHEELQRLRGELEFAEQESESTSSELRVANEEAMSLNEELQSSNEELQTSKEELQSTNEELSSVNSELEAKVDELERVLGDLRNLMDNTRVATLFLDRDLHIRRFTREATRLFRVIPSDEGRPLGDIAFRVSDPTLLADAQGVLDDASPRECEVSIAEGEWFLRRVVPYRAAGERIEGVVVTYVDISRLRRAAQDARRLAAVLQDANDAIIVHDFAGRILSWNQGAERAYGYAKKEALGLNIRVLEPAEVAGNALALAAAVRQAACGGPAIARRLTRDGRVLTVSVTTSALRDDAGEPYAVVTTERDVTEKLRQESELRFRALADDIPTLLRIDDFEGRAEFVNRAWLSFTGESHAESLLERGWFRYVHPDDLPGYLEGMRKAREEGRRFEGDLRLRRADGRYRWVRTTAVARTDEASPRPGFVSVAVDIEERKSAEQAIAKESERKDEFLAMLAHELRNPLSPIANAVTVIERRAPADPKVAWAAEVIGRQTRQLTRLVDDLMDVARITSGKVPLAHDLIEMAALVEQGRDSSQPLIESRSQRLEISVPPDTLYVEGDLGRLTQVIANLLNNASKYSNAGDTIALAVSSAGDEVVISVSDHGVGISAEMLPRVFELFAQEQKTLDRAQGGLGIGLTLVDRLVRAHGGRVEAISAGRGCGSEFIVRLPAVRPRPLKADADDTATHPPTSGRRILVVDDNADNATSTAVLLEHAGHAARTAGNGPDALVAAADFRPDVAILDIGLPGMNGYDLARELRARPETAGTLLIALTGYGQAEDRERVKSAGFDHHLVKPASFDQLMEMLK